MQNMCLEHLLFTLQNIHSESLQFGKFRKDFKFYLSVCLSIKILVVKKLSLTQNFVIFHRRTSHCYNTVISTLDLFYQRQVGRNVLSHRSYVIDASIATFNCTRVININSPRFPDVIYNKIETEKKAVENRTLCLR